VIEEIECDLRDVAEFYEYAAAPEERKKGRYHGSMFWSIRGFGRKKWVVGAYLDVDYTPYIEQGLEKEEIIQLCLNHLNSPPKRKKFQKKTESPLYGNLEIYSYKFRVSKSGNQFIEALLVTDQRKNKNFWGEGEKTES